MEIGSFLSRRRAECVQRIATKKVESKKEEQSTAEKLEVEHILTKIIEEEAHAQACEQSVDDITQGCSTASDKTIPTPFVKCALYAQHTDWSHRSRRHDSNQQSFPDYVQYSTYINKHCANIAHFYETRNNFIIFAPKYKLF